MTVHVEVDRGAQRLLVSMRAWEALRHRAGVTAEPPPECDDTLAALEQTGLVDDAGPVPDLARLVGVSAATAAGLLLTRGGHEVRGWVDAEAAVALVAREGGLFELAAVERRFAAELLARLVELGPRPEAPRSVVWLRPGEVALAIANGAAPMGDGAGPEKLRDHWRLDVTAPDGEPHGDRCLEVVDSATGWWELEPDQDLVAIRPTTETDLRRRIERALGDAARLPV